ncbi:carbon-nitrogen hydrolase family protein [Ruminiclostridium cellulolyticum]|uniref:Nitrilase/cyanide hydratase and apolipoprotein N-acyltransferase n=1 Tax=Ruminiclostridium cellulolyticum (strain ATCC 35319 / DSM 5812 / JCM 6584 / H10) TaxID=394503 RepID=B8I2S9_RUMCH|nr:carbon-nitrogen hydrolase family protein [Ruminiclostridium cellulolyticum]ACL76072.1 Nitrilase/cyanide hydratase and apolipoprotein N-acyltransferase [Ruminiclostridium cellulolyticum H10]
MNSKIKLGLCQMAVTDSKNENVKKAVFMLEECCKRGADIAVLPEMFNCPYDTKLFPLYAENFENSKTLSVISDSAKYNNMYIVAGTIPEFSNGCIYNTSIMFDRQGKIIAKHRKIHLFDVNIKDGVSFRESDVLAAGRSVTVAQTEFGRIGLAICFDMRFTELYSQMSEAGAKIIITPASFNMTTGPVHWELLVRARALDNQIFHAAVSSARNTSDTYISYGNSMVCDPWGRVISKADEKEGILIADIDLNMVNSVRSQIPVNKIID